MKTKFILIFLFLFGISFVSSVTLSMSPPQVNFVGSSNELICEKVSLEVQGNENLIGKTKWAEKGFNERNLLKHNLLAEDLKLEINFPFSVEINGVKEVDVCVKGKNTGNYHGVLLYKIEGKPVQVGIWLNVSLGEKGNGILGLTGNVVEGSGRIGLDGLLVGVVILLLIVLGLLIVKRRKRKP